MSVLVYICGENCQLHFFGDRNTYAVFHEEKTENKGVRQGQLQCDTGDVYPSEGACFYQP